MALLNSDVNKEKSLNGVRRLRATLDKKLSDKKLEEGDLQNIYVQIRDLLHFISDSGLTNLKEELSEILWFKRAEEFYGGGSFSLRSLKNLIMYVNPLHDWEKHLRLNVISDLDNLIQSLEMDLDRFE